MSRLIVSSELQRLTLTELWALHARIHEDLVRSSPGSTDRHNALASLENICRAIAAKDLSP